jgi:hypothetical protein
VTCATHLASGSSLCSRRGFPLGRGHNSFGHVPQYPASQQGQVAWTAVKAAYNNWAFKQVENGGCPGCQHQPSWVHVQVYVFAGWTSGETACTQQATAANNICYQAACAQECVMDDVGCAPNLFCWLCLKCMRTAACAQLKVHRGRCGPRVTAYGLLKACTGTAGMLRDRRRLSDNASRRLCSALGCLAPCV